MRASSICKIVHYVLFILFFAIGIYEYHRLEILAAQVQWVVDPFTGTRNNSNIMSNSGNVGGNVCCGVKCYERASFLCSFCFVLFV